MSKKKIILAAIVLLALIGGALTAYFVLSPKANDNSAGITVHVTVVHADGSSKVFDIKTQAQTLGDALDEISLVSGEEGEFGIFIDTVDGETVDMAAEEWWNITKGGEMMMTGVDDTMIADGDCYEITFTVGYEIFG